MGRKLPQERVIAHQNSKGEEYHIKRKSKNLTCIVVNGDEGTVLVDNCKHNVLVLPAVLCRYEVLIHCVQITKPPKYVIDQIQITCAALLKKNKIDSFRTMS